MSELHITLGWADWLALLLQFMLLSLMDDPAKLPIAGTVVWITPAGAQNSKAQGIGVHFKNDESGVEARRKIEGLLGGVMQSTRPTHTM